MEPVQLLTPKQRLVRAVGGLALLALSVVIFVVSDAIDPQNRGAVLSIVALIAGISILGQAIRGTHDGPIHREAPTVRGRPLSPAARLRGLVLAWLVPGLGHWTIGRRGKALLYFVVVTGCFLTGVVLAHGTNLSWDNDRIFFFAYGWNGGQTLLGWTLFGAIERDHPIVFLQMGYLYTAVAGLLNLVVLMDYEASAARGVLTAPWPRPSDPEHADPAAEENPEAGGEEHP